MTDEEREAEGIPSLPSSLKEALEALLRDEIICDSLGEHALQHFMEPEGNRMGYVPHTGSSVGTRSVYDLILIL